MSPPHAIQTGLRLAPVARITQTGDPRDVGLFFARVPSGGTRPSRARRRQFRDRVLAERIGTPAGTLEFTSNQWGRPELAGDVRDRVHFSCASTAGLMGIAVRQEPGLGFDVERHEPRHLDRALLREVLTAAEYPRVLRSGNPVQLFYDVWCAKEAVMKGAGIGLGWHPLEIEVPSHLHAGHAVSVQAPDGVNWHVRKVQSCPGVSMAYATRLPLPE